AARGVVDGVEVRWRTRTGVPLLVRLYGRRVEDERGLGFEGTAIDVTDLHAIEAEAGAQRALAERHEVALPILGDQLPAIIALLDRALRFTSVRGSGLRELGWTSAELVGRRLADVLPRHDGAIAHGLAALAGEPRRFEYETAGRQLAISVAPLRQGDAIVGAISIAVDVTEARRLEARPQPAPAAGRR